MYFETIKTPGLSQLSYIIGAGGQAAVIDPRRDCEIYVDKARAEGLEITHIFETHRNEDLISGSPILSEMTGARVYHGPNPAGEVVFAETAREGDCFELGQLRIEVLETPGHTDDHLAFVIHDSEYSEGPVGVFTGDALFSAMSGEPISIPNARRKLPGCCTIPCKRFAVSETRQSFTRRMARVRSAGRVWRTGNSPRSAMNAAIIRACVSLIATNSFRRKLQSTITSRPISG